MFKPNKGEKMARRKRTISPMQHLYERSPEYTLEGGRTISEGEIIKIDGIWGTKFKFKEYVVRIDNGKQWIDCYELDKGVLCGTRSFYPERIKPLPKSKRNKTKKTQV
jgi:hypothetical protein